MNIKKIQSYVKIEDEVNIFLDPVEIFEEDINIITDPSRNINHDRIFNLPGEYELGGVVINGFNGGKYSFLINNSMQFFYFTSQPTEELINDIKENFGDIDCVIAPEIKKPEIFLEKLGAKMFVTYDKPLKVGGFDYEKTRNIKLNHKKISRATYFLE